MGVGGVDRGSEAAEGSDEAEYDEVEWFRRAAEFSSSWVTVGESAGVGAVGDGGACTVGDGGSATETEADADGDECGRARVFRLGG